MSAFPIQLGGAFGGFGFKPLQRDRSSSRRASRSTSATRRTISKSVEASKPASADVERIAEIDVDDRSDELLLKEYTNGDRAAFTTLMKRYSNELVHFLTRFLGSRAAADDVFQDTFLQIHLSADTFDDDRRFKPWLFTIAANKARDYHRKHNRGAAGGAMSLSSSIDSQGEGERFVDLLESEVPTPDTPLLDAERSRIVKQVMDSLPLHLREILLLSYFQRLSYNDIARDLTIPLGTVKSRLHTAVAAFARAWKLARANGKAGVGGDAGDVSGPLDDLTDGYAT